MADTGGDLAGEVATHRNATRQAVTFSAVRLDLTAPGGWRAGTCRLVRADGGETVVACATLSAISADGASFSVTVDDGTAAPPAEIAGEGLVTGFPAGADCFVFRRDAHGFWDGVTLTAAAGRVVVAPFACDPA